MKKAHAAISLVALVALVWVAWWLQNRSVAPPQGAGSSAQAAGGQKAAPGGPVPVEVGRAQVQRLEDDAQAVGTVRSRQGVMLRPEVGGRVASLGFEDGQRVRRGQVLVKLDDALQQAQLQQALAQASIARTNLQRNRELVAQGFVSQSAVDQAQANLEVADAQVALARAQLQRMTIAAPFDGTVGIRAVSVGDYVKDGADLVQLEDSSSVWVDFRLPERHAAQLRKGQEVHVKLDALPQRLYSARLEAVDSLLDASGRSLLVRARLANATGELRSGMFARTRIVFGSRERAITVPEEALVPSGDQQYLIKVADGPQGERVSQRIVARIGARTLGRVEVLEGLKPGDLVVVAGQARLMRGEAVPLRIVEVGAAAAPASAAAGAGASQPASGAGRTNPV